MRKLPNVIVDVQGVSATSMTGCKPDEYIIALDVRIRVPKTKGIEIDLKKEVTPEILLDLINRATVHEGTT